MSMTKKELKKRIQIQKMVLQDLLTEMGKLCDTYASKRYELYSLEKELFRINAEEGAARKDNYEDERS